MGISGAFIEGWPYSDRPLRRLLLAPAIFNVFDSFSVTLVVCYLPGKQGFILGRLLNRLPFARARDFTH